MFVYISLIALTNVVFWIPLPLTLTSTVLITVVCVCSVHTGFHCWPPHGLFCNYLQSCDKLFPFHPQLWLCADGSVPTCGWFICWSCQHFPSNVGGHSLWAGGATALAQAGIPPHIIQVIGCWASDTFQIYICHHPILLTALLFSSTPLSHWLSCFYHTHFSSFSLPPYLH